MSRSEPLFAVCAVDQVPTWVFDKLLSARDSDWRDRRRQAGKGITTTPNGYTSDGVPLNEETDPEHFWDLCVARALTSDDDVSVTVPPVGHFLSPFLDMTPEEVAGALHQKAADSRVLSDKIFVIVDLRSAIDDTVLVCERQDEDEDGNELETSSIGKVRSQMAAVNSMIVNLEIANMDFQDFVDEADDNGGVLPVTNLDAT